ncbi:TetR/AcrR family transcriptional regulator C-terminal domain-containing protein [Mycolicibacterium confluentis]|uniref:TetR family transcriptional regulator n=1 Tax=Mycolicibacterium confluentis TaxID=28047 RepID=A0A7I7XY20_9MYCO|nr:TetR/AcrR family transcriptional regulator C-terminal domain-containing protein [Mycolicibacterium confluentis]MCV7322029.1 TetR/AcrR family transcriptional regulator C-terminal domain-containing protein [Mycolicibacterium confluentis]ORV32262.1 TetR family transcriptional regulator [Mycolicibacterium confluentis]BBZ33853.1 TetR family transcriptional regulator [Mycolicibacterium confluentis]
MQLHKRALVTKALEILDNYGLADLTMRRLARELEVTPGALYWHFANKQELLGAVADDILAPVCSPAQAADWQSSITTLCSRLRDALLSHTDGAELVSASFSTGQSTAVSAVLERLAEAAVDAGTTPARAELAARTIVHYVLGFTGDEQSRLQWDAAGALPAEQSVFDPAAAPGAAFDFGLSLLIDGLAVQAAASAPTRDRAAN